MAITVRKATKEDINTLVEIRLAYMAVDFAPVAPEEMNAITAQLHRYFEAELENGSFCAMLAVDGGRAVASAFMALSLRPPNTECVNGKVGTVLNVYTHPAYRRKGLAKTMMEHLLAWAQQQGATYVELSSSENGLPLYEQLGFTVSHFTQMGRPINHKNKEIK